MDPISNSDLAATASQPHMAGASYINSRDLLTHFANLSSHERPKSKSPNIPGSTPNNNAGTSTAGIYSAILNSQQQHQPVAMDEAPAPATAFSSPIRHLSEPSTAPARRSPIDEPMRRTPRSCRTSPSVPLRSFHQLQQSPPRSLDSSPNNNSMEPQSTNASSTASVFSLTHSGLQELIRKSGNSISAEEIKKANNSSQLYLLVPSNYPVLLAVGNEREKAAATAAAASVNEATTRSLLERFQLNSNPPQQSIPSPQLDQAPASTPAGQAGQPQQQRQPSVMLRAPRKNSTNIPPMILQSLKGVVPPINFREILESGGVPMGGAGSGNNSTGSGTNTSSHLSSLALAYGGSVAPGSDLPPSLTSSISSDLDRKKSLTVSPDPSFLGEFRAANAGGGGGEVKVKPPPPSSSGTSTTASVQESGLCPSDGILGPDSNGSLYFASTNDSPPTRNYMGRMGGGAGGVGGNQGNASGGDSKDIRRRVSHNEVERRRRDRINTWIAELYKLLPPEQQAKSQYQSKGVVLKRVCEYFQNYDATLKALREENAIFKQEVCRLTRENHLLRSSINAAHFQQQNSATSGAAVAVSNAECEDSKAPSPSKRTHFATPNE